jgi:hypothetical protein
VRQMSKRVEKNASVSKIVTKVEKRVEKVRR